MSDWELVQDQSSQSAPIAQSDWEIVQPAMNSMKANPKENLAMSLLQAAPRIGEDLYRGAANAVQAAPDYWNQAQTEVPGLLNAIVNPVQNHPSSMFKQLLAGGNEAINSLAQTPLNLVKYGADRLNLLPQGVPNALAKITPQDTTQAINELFGQPQYPGEALARGSIRNLPAIVPASKLLAGVGETGLNAIRRIDPVKVAKSIQNSHDTLHTSAKNDFKNVEKGAYARNISSVPLRKDLIADIAEHPLMPKSEKIQNILDKAYSGDYSGLRNLQSELWQRGTKAVRSPLISESNAGESLFDLRDEINNSIKNHLEKTGNVDLAKILNDATKKYKLLKDTYYHKKTPLAIKNLVDPEVRKIPKNLMDVLSQESLPMNRVKKQNPIAAKTAEQYKAQTQSRSNLKKAAAAAAVATALPVGVNKLLGNSNE